MTLTDVATGSTECLALLSHHQEEVVRGLRQVQELLPFPLLGLDTDNGTEFMNNELLGFCRKEKLTFTRSRPYKKNDQCHVEQKNGTVVRRMVGYDRAGLLGIVAVANQGEGTSSRCYDGLSS